MEALARSLEASAWPENAGTGRLGKLQKNKRKKKGGNRMKKNSNVSQSMPNMLGGLPKSNRRGGESGTAYVDAEQMHMRQRQMKLAETRRRRKTRRP